MPARIERLAISDLPRGREAGHSVAPVAVAVLLARSPSPRSLARPLANQARESLSYAVVETMHHHVHRDIDRMGESLRVRAAMRLYHDPVQTEHDRAVIAARIEPFAQSVEARTGQEVGK